METQKHFRKNFFPKGKAFTLVELIVVIIILAILATVALMAYMDHAASARDAVRISAIKGIHKGLMISNSRSGTFPDPDMPLVINGAGRQGYVGDKIRRFISLGGAWKDPLDDSFYIYNTNPGSSKIQISGFLEINNTILLTAENPFFDAASAATSPDYRDRYLYTTGDRVGILLDPDTKTPVNMTMSIGSLDLNSNTGTYAVIFSNSSANSGTIVGSGTSLLTEISIIQNSCILGDTSVPSGGQINAYNTESVAYDQTCIPKIRKCSNGSWDGDSSYSHDTCSPEAALDCTPTTFSGYSIPAISHDSTANVNKNITGGVADIQASCVNGNLSYGIQNINCSTNYVLQGGACLDDLCTGSAPDFSLVNGTQKFGMDWMHNTVAGQCTFICQAGYYWNSPYCNAASMGNTVPTSGQISQTPCSSNNTYQDTTGQASCKTVSAGYYSTPIGAGAKTQQVQCEENNYCVNGTKTACPVGYSSPAGSTSVAACTIDSFAVSGSFGSNANGATINVCGTNVTANPDGSFSTIRSYGSVCNSITAARTGYTCNTTTNGPASLVGPVSDIAGSCVPNTQSAACAALTVGKRYYSGTGSYSITQTWNGSGWTPLTTQSYSATPAANTCQYSCSPGYGWNGTACTAIIAGTCGSDNNANLTATPTNLCSSGTPSSVTSASGGWTWSCNGSVGNGGSNSSCSANLKVNGVCGATTGACSVGTATSVSGAGPWSWSCSGTNGGSAASCNTADAGVAGWWRFEEGKAYNAYMKNALSLVPAQSIKTDGGKKVFSDIGMNQNYTTEFIPVDPSKTYNLSGLFKSAGATASKLFYGVATFDANKNYISAEQVIRIGNDVIISSFNATSITVDRTISGWWDSSQAYHLRSLGFYYDGNTDKLPDYVMIIPPNGAYSSAIGTTITLNYNLPDHVMSNIILGKTVVKNHGSGGTYLYSAAAGETVGNTWTKYEANITGEGFGNGGNMFRLGTRYVKILYLNNYGQGNEAEIHYDELKFKEVGTVTADSSGNGNNGIMQGGAAWGGGKIGNAAYFNGSSYVQIPNIGNSPKLTISLWTRQSGTIDSNTQRTFAGNEKSYLHLSYGKPRYTIYSSVNQGYCSTTYCQAIGSEIWSPDLWYHIVGVFDGTNIYIYENGSLKQTNPWNVSIASSANPFYIGGSIWGNSVGWIDEVKVYNRALNADEIKSMYDTQK